MKLLRNKSGTGRRRFSPLLWLASLGAVAVLALGVTGTLAQFTAIITNNQNHVQSAGVNSFGLSESLVDADGVTTTPPCQTVTAGESAICSAINKYGSVGAVATPMAPGQAAVTTTVELANTALTTPAGLSGALVLSAGSCTDQTFPPPGTAGTGLLCGVVEVTISCAGTPVIGPVTLTALATGSNITPTPVPGSYDITTLAAGGTERCAFSTQIPASAGTGGPGNPLPTALQDLLTSQNLTWTLTSV
jgi:hypothetical protein